MVTTFNGVDDDGRQNAVIRELQHAFEMLLKASLWEKNNVTVFDKKSGRSIGFDKCVRLAREHLGLSDEQLGLLRAIDALRDDEQHWLAELNEGLLYLHARAAVTLFDEILDQAFGERLASHLPERVLPISTKPPTDLDILVDEQYAQVKDLLKPGKRRRAEARAMLRGLLALEGHVSEGHARVSERDVNRVEKAIRKGTAFSGVSAANERRRLLHGGRADREGALHQTRRGAGHVHLGGRPARRRRRPRGRSTAQVLPKQRGLGGEARVESPALGGVAAVPRNRRR